MIKTLDDLESLISEDSEKESIPPSDVVAFNELRSCYELHRLSIANTLELDPSYQRDFVWKDADQTRFIDSLHKGLPIPSLCLSYDYKKEVRQVIDGRQRISTIVKFLTDNSWRLSKLDDIDANLSGKTVEEIRSSHPEIIKRIENVTIPVTVLRCDLNKKNHLEYIYSIFHRLNAGGIKLTNQEIRNAVFQGPYNDFLKRISTHEELRPIYGDPNKTDRFKKIELILRFFAFYHNSQLYRGKLNVFLNDFMFEKREQEIQPDHPDYKIVLRTVKIVTRIFSGHTREQKFKSNVYLEALMHGIAKNIETAEQRTDEELRGLSLELLQTPSFSDDSILEGTMQKDKVLDRLGQATELFS